MADDPNAARRRASRRDRDPGADGDEAAPQDAVDQVDSSDADAAPSLAEPTDADAFAAPAEPGPSPESVSGADEVDASAEGATPDPLGTTPDADGTTVSSEAEDVDAVGSPRPDPLADRAEAATAPAEDNAPAEDMAAAEAMAAAEDTAVAEAPVAATATTLWESPDGTPAASLPWLQARSPDDRICPFLRAVAADDHLGFPVESPDAANRCASMHEAVPQSLRQQELVCLTANHVNCPRYLRGAAETATVVPVARVRPKAVMTPAISAALIILALSFGASVAFGLANGGLAMPSRAAVAPPTASATSVAAATATPATSSPAASPAVASPAAASPSLEPTPAPSATASPSASTTPIPSPSASASLATGPTPSPTSNRLRLLKPCPNKPNCWIYTVRSGDNLYSIAHYFGVPLGTVRSLNPWTKTESLRAGKKLILPNPTR